MVRKLVISLNTKLLNDPTKNQMKKNINQKIKNEKKKEKKMTGGAGLELRKKT